MVHLSMMLQVLLMFIMHWVRVWYRGLILELVCILTLVMLVLVFLGTLWLSLMILSWLLLLVSEWMYNGGREGGRWKKREEGDGEKYKIEGEMNKEGILKDYNFVKLLFFSSNIYYPSLLPPPLSFSLTLSPSLLPPSLPSSSPFPPYRSIKTTFTSKHNCY